MDLVKPNLGQVSLFFRCTLSDVIFTKHTMYPDELVVEGHVVNEQVQ